MKRIALLFILSVGFFNLKAQIISPRVGIGFSSIATSGGVQKTDLSSLFRAHIGAQYEHKFNEKLYGITGLILEGKGAKEKREDSGFDVEITYKPVYLIVPLQVKYLIKGNSIDFFTNGGIYTAIGIGGKAKQLGTYNGKSLDKEVSYFGDAGIKRLDFGIELGGGIKVPINSYNVEFGLLLSFGLTNLGDSNVLNVNTAKNQSFKIYAAVPLSGLIR